MSRLPLSLCFLALVFFACDHNAERTPERGKVFPKPQIPFAPRHYICYRSNEPLRIDGLMTEKAWRKASWTEDFTDIQGALKPQPRFRTRAKMLWDERFFYVLAELEEPHVWATLKQRDSVIYYDNDFEVFIDPDGDTHRYYELEINAFGTFWDLFLDRPYRDNGKAIFFWDIRGIQIGVHVDGTLNNPHDRDRGWSVEVAIPWEVLRECAEKPAPPEDGDIWRVNFSRVEWQTEVRHGRYVKVTDPATGKPLPEDNWVWSPQGLINMHYPEMWGFVVFRESATPEGATGFTTPEEDSVKWVLRTIYYSEKEFFLNHGRFTKDRFPQSRPAELPASFGWPPTIQVTESLFEAILEKKDGSERWYIDSYGRVWKQE